MVYCTRCGAKNEDNAVDCTNCGAPLDVGRTSPRAYRRSRREEEMCFGAEGCFRPWFGRAAGIILGLFIVLIGLLSFVQSYFNVEMWPLVLIALGVIVIVGGFLAYTRR